MINESAYSIGVTTYNPEIIGMSIVNLSAVDDAVEQDRIYNKTLVYAEENHLGDFYNYYATRQDLFKEKINDHLKVLRAFELFGKVEECACGGDAPCALMFTTEKNN